MINQARVLAAVASLLLLSPVPSARADWTAHADFSSCPRSKFPRATAEEGPFGTQSECEAKVAEAKRGNNASCARYSCTEGAASGGTSSAAPGHELDSTIERAISAGVSGDISGADAAGLVAAGVLGNALLAGIAKSPEQQQQEQQQAEAQRQYQQQLAEEQARQRAAEEEERKNRLLGEMQGVEQGADLQLMTDEDVERSPVGSAGGGGELALMTDDDSQDFMGKRRVPAPKRNQPPATRVNTGPYTPGAVPRAGAAGAGDQPVAMNAARPQPPSPERRPEPESRARGELDGHACRQRSPGALCGGLDVEATDRCQRNYNLGYDEGVRKHAQELTASGAAAGARDKTASTPNRAMSYAEARGSCGNIFVQAYNNAFR